MSIDKVAKELLSTMKSADESGTKPYDTPATVLRVEGDTAWVHIPGGVDETPVKRTVSAKAGDIVQVRVANGTAWITGNLSNPPTDDTEAVAAKNQAIAAGDMASAAIEDALRAYNAAETAEGYSRDAKHSAENASEYAARALGNLSTVQNVTETLNWITQHGTMTLTQDTDLDPTHVYFVVDPQGDYIVRGVNYSVVTEPKIDDVSTYYELSIDESLNNYVATHLAVTNEGLWLIPEESGTPISSSKKILIAIGGQGHTYKTAGTYIIEKINGVDVVVAKFLGNGVQIGQDEETHAEISSNSMKLIDYQGNPYMYISDLRIKVPGEDLPVATLTEILTGDGTSAEFLLGTPEIYTINSVYMDGVEITNEVTQKGKNIIEITPPPDNGAVIEVEYTTRDVTAKAYTFGVRQPDANVGSMSIAEGYLTIASKLAAHAEGNHTQANDISSHAEGYYTEANGISSHAEGFGVKANGFSSHAEGFYTKALGNSSHAEGYYTKALGNYSHAEGYYTEALGNYSHAQNQYTTAGYDNQTTIGKYNKNQSDTAFEIGNGAGINNRSNALTVDWDGNVEASGDLTDGSGNKLSDIPTKTSDLTNDSNFVSDASYVHTDNNYTASEKTKLAGIETGAEVNVQSDWNQTTTTADDFIKNKPSIAMGRVSVGQIAANSYGDVTITHNLGSNARAVAVLFSSGTASNIGNVCVALSAKTAKTATFRVFNNRSSTINPALEWIAISK